MVMDPLTYSEEKKQRERHPSAQSFPDGTDRSHYLHRLCSGSQGNAALFHNRWFNDPNLFCVFFLTRGLISIGSEEDGSPSWKSTLLMHRCGVTPTHLLERDKPSNSHLPPYGSPYDIQSSSWEYTMHWSARIVFIKRGLPPFRSPVNCGTISTIITPLLSVWLRMVNFVHEA